MVCRDRSRSAPGHILKQVIQSYRTGELELVEVPAPALRPSGILVRTVASLVSVGTERYMLEMARKSLAGKAIARPDLARQVLDKVRTEGFAEAFRQAMGRLDDPVALGYSSAGIVVGAGSAVDEFSVGDRVACSGSGHASHAEFVSVPKNLAVKIPEVVSYEEASFVTLGAIAMHGVRMARPELGERVVVLGLGLIGLLAVQILKASGCRILGADVDPAKVRMALDQGADAGTVIGQGDLLAAARGFSDGAGADAVLVFAASEGNEPIEQAAAAARERGRIVVPGLVGLDLPRKLFYEKELSFVVSRAWGPGLSDPLYEQRGVDYPVSFVRWTAQRNLAQFLELVADRKVRLEPLITHRFAIERAVEAYEMILAGKERFIGVLLTYPGSSEPVATVRLRAPVATPTPPPSASPAGTPSGKVLTPRPVMRLGLIGAGLFARGTLLPALKTIPGCELRGLATSSGMTGHHIGRKYGFALCSTRASEILGDPEIDLVLILTRHGSHAGLVRQALEAGKHVYVEKPLALDEQQLAEVEQAYSKASGQLMVGFNRRFAPTTVAALGRLEALTGPLTVVMRVNAGYAPPESWVHDPEEGGGRIIGEVCHFVDLAQALTRSLPVSVYAESVEATGRGLVENDTVAITIRMADGSLATILYTAGGDKAFSRERVEVFGGGAACVIENFKTMEWSQDGRRRRSGHGLSAVDRGHRAEMHVLIDRLRRGEPMPVPFEEYVATTRATFAALESLRLRRPVSVPRLPSGPPSR